MKTTEALKRTIEDYLKVRANTDELFAKAFQKEDKKLCALCRRYNPISYKGKDKIYHYCQYGDMCYPCSGGLCNYHERFERVE